MVRPRLSVSVFSHRPNMELISRQTHSHVLRTHNLYTSLGV